MSKNLVGRCKFEDKLNINSDIIQCLNTKYYSCQYSAKIPRCREIICCKYIIQDEGAVEVEAR